MLELQNICYRVSTPEEELDILRDISITIPDQRLMVFTGPNGGGKTTLAKIIMGLVQPTSGRILYNGRDVTPLSITDRARLGISYGFQQPPRFKGITVHDLLRLAAGLDDFVISPWSVTIAVPTVFPSLRRIYHSSSSTRKRAL